MGGIVHDVGGITYRKRTAITRGMNWFRQNRLRVEIRHTGSLLKMVDMPVCLQYGYDKSARNMS